MSIGVFVKCEFKSELDLVPVLFELIGAEIDAVDLFIGEGKTSPPPMRVVSNLNRTVLRQSLLHSVHHLLHRCCWSLLTTFMLGQEVSRAEELYHGRVRESLCLLNHFHYFIF